MEKIILKETQTIIREANPKEYLINKSAYFLLPLLDIEVVKNSNFINTYLYINDSINLDVDKHLFYLEVYMPKRELENSNLFINKITTKHGTTIYKYKFPEEFNEEYYKFLEGKYSKFSDKAKGIICKKAAGKAPLSTTQIYGILYQTAKRKKYLEELIGVELDSSAELTSIPRFENEIYNYE